MAGNLGHRSKVGALSADNRITSGNWLIVFRPEDLPRDVDFEMYHAAVRGPGGYFLVYIDDKLYGVGENGRINEYAPSIPMYVRKGQAISLHWSIATGTAPTCWIYLREPEVGRL